MAGEVKQSQADALSYGVSRTPVFSINDKMLPGAKPIAAFDAAIQEALANKTAAAAN